MSNVQGMVSPSVKIDQDIVDQPALKSQLQIMPLFSGVAYCNLHVFPVYTSTFKAWGLGRFTGPHLTAYQVGQSPDWWV